MFKIKWDKEDCNFSFNTDDGLHFYGWWRYTKILKTDTIVNAVDVFVKREHEDPEKYIDVCVESIIYDEDPRVNKPSLNADICAAANKWFHQNFNGDAKGLDQLIKQAKYPTIHISQLGTLDNLILKLKEFRHAAIASGGTRVCELRGDKTNQPPLIVSINVTEQSLALKGKIPTLVEGKMVDAALRSERGEDVRKNFVAYQATPENVVAIVEQLKQTKDKQIARKLRSMLRSMGHKGGARSLT